MFHHYDDKTIEPAHEIMVLITQRPAKAQASLCNCPVLPEPSLFTHIKYGSRRRVQPKIRHQAPLDGCAYRLKNEFTEDEKYHNLMRWLISCVKNGTYLCLELLDPSGIIEGINKTEECFSLPLNGVRLKSRTDSASDIVFFFVLYYHKIPKYSNQRTSGPVNAHLTPGPDTYFKTWQMVYFHIIADSCVWRHKVHTHPNTLARLVGVTFDWR